jgi:hypothetical protein
MESDDSKFRIICNEPKVVEYVTDASYCAVQWSIITNTVRNKLATNFGPTTPPHTVAKITWIEKHQVFMPHPVSQKDWTNELQLKFYLNIALPSSGVDGDSSPWHVIQCRLAQLRRLDKYVLYTGDTIHFHTLPTLRNKININTEPPLSTYISKSWFSSRQQQAISFFSQMFRPVLGPSQPRIYWAPGAPPLKYRAWGSYTADV